MFGFPIEYIKYCFEWAKKALIVVTVLFVVFQLFVYFMRSNTNTQPVNIVDSQTQFRKNIYSIINDPELTKTPEGKKVAKIYQQSICFITGEACSNDPNAANQGGVTGFLASSLIWPITHPPSSGVYWVKDTLEKSGFIPKTYAQTEGVGFASLAPFREIWLVFRNLIFMLMVLVIIVIGFMIMFRAKINPQTVITIENALPKIVISMLLVTFSYAIAGFMIDLMYVSIGLLTALFNTIPNMKFDVARFAYGFNAFDIFGALNFNSTDEISQGLYNLLPGDLQLVLNQLAVGVLSFLFFKPIGTGAGTGNASVSVAGFLKKAFVTLKQGKDAAAKIGTSSGGLGGISLAGVLVSIGIEEALTLGFGGIVPIFLINILLLLTLLLVWFKLFFKLLQAYIQILLLILFAPFFMAVEAVPGRSAFSTWLKNMFYHLLTFPLFIVIILISKVLTTIGSDGNGLILWQPPFLGGVSAHTFNVIIAGVLVFSAPKFIEMVQSLTGIKPIAAGQGIGPGTFFAGGAALLTTMTGASAGAQSLFSRSTAARRFFLGDYSVGPDGRPKYNKAMGKLLGGWLDPNAASRKYYEGHVGQVRDTENKNQTGTPAADQKLTTPNTYVAE